jgi:hypothetical protein
MAYSRASVSAKVGAPADKVWEHIGSFANLKAIMQGALSDVKVDKTGTIRKIKVKGVKGLVTERLVKYDSLTRTQIYAILDLPNNIVPFVNYTATIKVAATTARSSTITWSSRFEPKKGETAKSCQEFAQGIYQLGIGGVEKNLGLSKPKPKAAAKPKKKAAAKPKKAAAKPKKKAATKKK